jgi:hypothetical protein
MASALYSVPLASTPPVSTPRSSGSASRPRSAIVNFSRSSTNDDAAGSWKGSYAESASQSQTFSRSFGRSLGRTPESGSVRSLASCRKPPTVQRQQSIPKSASFVRQEGFAAKGDSPFSTPPASPQPRSLSGLLSRQLSMDGTVVGFSFDDPLAAINRLEHSLRLSPAVAPAPRPRTDLNPAELLKSLQVRADAAGCKRLFLFALEEQVAACMAVVRVGASAAGAGPVIWCDCPVARCATLFLCLSGTLRAGGSSWLTVLGA